MEIISEELIKPSSPTPDFLKDQKLSYLDQILEKCYIPSIFLYESQSTLMDRDSPLSQQLKQSFSEALTKFYTFAGRLNGNTSVICDDSGALFVEARAHLPLSEALHENGASKNFTKYLAIDPYGDDSSSSNIPLMVTINFFDCGGIAIGICLSHKVADLSLLAAFMNVWSGIQRGETGIREPNLNLGCQYFPPLALENIPQPSLHPSEKVVTRRFVFDKEKIIEIKKLFSSASDSKVQNPTRVEAVVSFIWKHIIDVTRAVDETKTTFALLLSVNLRPKIFPGQPDSIIGGNFFLALDGTCGDQEMSNQCLVNVVRNTKTKFNHQLVKINTQNGSFYYNQLVLQTLELFSKPETAVCLFTSWCNFPLYQVDYGWGKPISVATVAFPNKNGVVLMDTRSGDGIEAWITMLEDEVAMLPIEFLSLENNHILF